MTSRVLGVLAVVVWAFPAAGQDTTAVAEPEFEGVFMRLDQATGSLLPLERKTPRARTSRGLIAGAKVAYEIAGRRSTVRLSTNEHPAFIVRVPNREGDPYALLQFFAMEVEGNKRVMTVGTVSSWDGAVTRGYDEKQLVRFEVARHGERSYRMWPATPLLPGDYCIGLATASDGFCFGVDAPGR